MENLKPCPFCGGEMRMYRTGLSYYKYCIVHKKDTECIFKDLAVAKDTEYEVKGAWNRRANEN